MIIRTAEEKDFPEILRLNEADVEMLSPMDDEKIRKMKEILDLFQVVEIDKKVAAFQMVFRESAPYWSLRYAWLREHYPKFLYVDRIVVSREYRHRGIGSRLYEEVICHAKKTDVPIITAEIDIEPEYNVESIRFHRKIGFVEVSTKIFDGITVSFQVLDISEAKR